MHFSLPVTKLECLYIFKEKLIEHRIKYFSNHKVQCISEIKNLTVESNKYRCDISEHKKRDVIMKWFLCQSNHKVTRKETYFDASLSLIEKCLLLLTHFGESPVCENLVPPIFWHN